MGIIKNIRSLRVLAFLLFLTPVFGLLGSLGFHNFLVSFKFQYDFKYNFIENKPGEQIDILCTEKNNFCKNGVEFEFNNKLSECNKYLVKGDYYTDNKLIIVENRDLIKDFKKKVFYKLTITDQINKECILNTKYNKIYDTIPLFFESIAKLKNTDNFNLGTSEVVNPIIYGETSISNIVKRHPVKYIFKPLLFISFIIMIFYWIYYNKILNKLLEQEKINYFFVFGILSALFLLFHVYFLGTVFENEVLAKIRRSLIVFFILFELLAQAFLIKELFYKKDKIIKYLHKSILYLKLIFVLTVCFASVLIIAILIIYNLDSKADYILEWNYFLILLIFYFLSSIMWKKNI
tara:strand:- start:222 stop:1268 length:1047 start_codon:yes stop_codon:yes gene_type:complete